MYWFLDLIFPKICVNCGKFGKYVCQNCEVGLWEEEQICPICSRSSRYGLRHAYCHNAYGLDGLTCFWAYEGVARKIITKAKYKSLFELLSELIVKSNSERVEFTGLEKFLESKPMIVPVPLSPSRERWRGFNQAKIITDLVGREWRLEGRDLLMRIKDSGQQVGRTRQERLDTVINSFQISKFKFQIPQAILLVDDVWTTGATMSECCKVLKKSGVKQVWGLVLAR